MMSSDETKAADGGIAVLVEIFEIFLWRFPIELAREYRRRYGIRENHGR